MCLTNLKTLIYNCLNNVYDTKEYNHSKKVLLHPQHDSKRTDVSHFKQPADSGIHLSNEYTGIEIPQS